MRPDTRHIEWVPDQGPTVGLVEPEGFDPSLEEPGSRPHVRTEARRSASRTKVPRPVRRATGRVPICRIWMAGRNRSASSLANGGNGGSIGPEPGRS